MRNCISCNVELNDSNFKWYRAKNYIWKCTPCINREKRKDAAIKRRSNAKETERTNIWRLKQKSNDPVRYTCKQLRGSAHKRAGAMGWEFDLTTEFLVANAPTHCPILGVELKYGGGDKANNSASLDRIDSSKGYTKNNVQIISMLANLMKSNATQAELITFARWVLAREK